MADMVSVNSGFHTRKNFSENFPQFWHTPSKRLASPILGQKSLKNIGSKGRHIISLPGALMSGALPEYYVCDLTQDNGSYIVDKKYWRLKLTEYFRWTGSDTLSVHCEGTFKIKGWNFRKNSWKGSHLFQCTYFPAHKTHCDFFL
jgi:hypothetical protein